LCDPSDRDMLDLLVSLWQTKNDISESTLEQLWALFKPFVEAKMSTGFPSTLHNLYRRVGIDCDNCSKYVVCPVCTQTYWYDEVVQTGINGQVNILKCTHQQYEQGKYTQPCHADLVKEIFVKQQRVYVPFKYYCYSL